MATYRAILLGLLLPVLASGCGGGTLPPQADPGEARTVLIAALDAWKAGETAEMLAGRTPPIYFNELQDRRDVRLVAYTVLEGHTQYGQSLRLTVQMTLKFPDGTVKEKKANYLIDTAPARVIVPG